MVIFFGSASEDLDNLPWKCLKTDKSQNRDNQTDDRCFAETFPDTSVFSCSVIKADQRLQSLRGSDDQREENHTYLRYDPGTGKGNFTAIDRVSSIIGQRVIHYNLYDHHSHLIQTWSHTQRKNLQPVGKIRPQIGKRQLHSFEVCQICNYHDRRYNLADYGSIGGTLDTKLKAEDKQRIQNRIDNCSRKGAEHGKTGTSICTDQMGASRGQNQEGEAPGGDSGVGKCIIQNI